MSYFKKFIILFLVFASNFILCQFDAFSDDEIEIKGKKSGASKSDDFAEAMKAIEKVRKEDIKTEILRIDKKIATSRLHKNLRDSVSDAVKRLDDDAVEKIKSKIDEAESFAKKILEENPEKIEDLINLSNKDDGSESDELPSPPELNEVGTNSNASKTSIAKPLPERVRQSEEGENDTIIDADGRLIFDGSSSLGPDYQVVIFEDNVVVTHPSFVMKSDKLEARFKKVSRDNQFQKGNTEINPDQLGAGRLEIAEATGREVVVTRRISDDQVQVAKAGKVIFKAANLNDANQNDKIILEVFPSVQKGQSKVIAKSLETRIILVGEEMIVEGPVRTQIVGVGLSDVENQEGENEPNLPESSQKETIIDAENGAVFNKPSNESNKRQLIFEGNVSVSDSDFNLLSNKLTAYVHPFSKTGLIDKAIAEGNDQYPAQIKHLSEDGKMHLGKAGSITFLGSSGDIIMDEWPEVRRDEHSSIANRRDAQIILKRDGSISSRGVDTKIFREKEKEGR